MAAQVLIELIPDVSKVESSLDQLQRKGAVSDGAASAYKAGNVEIQKRNSLLANEAQASSKVDAAERKHIVTLQDLQKNAGKMAGTVLAQVNALTQETTAHTKAAGAAGTEMKAQESLRSEKRRLTAEISKLILAGQQESAQFQELVARAGEVDDAMRDAGDAIKRTGSDTRGLDTTIMAAQGIAAGFTVATATAALFGEESEEVQQVLLKVNAAMALLNGLQEIQNILKSEYVKTLAASITTQRVQNANIAIENGLNSKSIVVRVGATVAQRALNAAMAANPLGLLVTGIALLITAFGAYGIATAKARRAQEDLDRAMEASTKGIDEHIEALNNLNNVRISTLESVNAAQSEILSQELANFKSITDEKEGLVNNLWMAILAAQKAGVKASAEDLEQWSKDYDEVIKRRADAQVQTNKLNKQLLDEAQNQTQAAAERAVKLARNGSNAEIAARMEVAKVVRDQALDGLRRQKEVLKTETAAMVEQRMNIEAQYNDAIESLQNELVDRQRATNQRRLAAEKEAISNLLIAVREGSAEQLKIREDEINKQAQLDKASIDTRNVSADIVAKERANIEKRAHDEIAKLRKDFAKKEAKDVADIELFAAQARVAAFREGTAEYYSAQRIFLGQQAQSEELAVQQSEDSEKVKASKILLINANLNKALGDLNRQQVDEQIARQRATIEALDNLAQTRFNIKASDPRLNEAQRFAAEQDARTNELRRIEAERAKIEEDYRNGRIKSEEEMQTAITNNTAAAEQKRSEIVFASLAREKELRQAIAQQAFDIVSAFVASEFATRKAARDADLQSELDKLAAERDSAVSIKNITEAQKAAINRRYQQEERRIKREAAVKERQAQRDQIIANGIVAAAKTLAVYGFTPAAAVAIAGQAALTLIQLSELSRTPLPAYEKGTQSAKKGYALVGEKGPEIVQFAGGERVWTHTQSDKMMKDWNAANHTAAISNIQASQHSNSTIDYDELAKALAKHIKIPTPNILQNNFDKHGHTMHMLSEGRKLTILNQRFISE